MSGLRQDRLPASHSAGAAGRAGGDPSLRPPPPRAICTAVPATWGIGHMTLGLSFSIWKMGMIRALPAGQVRGLLDFILVKGVDLLWHGEQRSFACGSGLAAPRSLYESRELPGAGSCWNGAGAIRLLLWLRRAAHDALGAGLQCFEAGVSSSALLTLRLDHPWLGGGRPWLGGRCPVGCRMWNGVPDHQKPVASHLLSPNHISRCQISPGDGGNPLG